MLAREPVEIVRADDFAPPLEDRAAGLEIQIEALRDFLCAAGACQLDSRRTFAVYSRSTGADTPSSRPDLATAASNPTCSGPALQVGDREGGRPRRGEQDLAAPNEEEHVYRLRVRIDEPGDRAQNERAERSDQLRFEQSALHVAGIGLLQIALERVAAASIPTELRSAGGPASRCDEPRSSSA